MADLKPVYLIHGDDHGRIAERRSKLRALGEAEGGAGSVEVLDGDTATPAGAAAALSTMTFATGRRVIIVDGVERWKAADMEPLEAALAAPPPDTTIAFFAREDGRTTVPERLVKAVAEAGGDVRAEGVVKPWELPKWVAGQSARLGIALDAGAAKAFVAQVGDRPQRLLRELERLALELGAEASLSADDVVRLAAPSAERRAWTLADALVARDAPAATRLYLTLRAQGERLAGLVPMIARRMREAHGVALRLEAGEAPAQVKRGLRMPPKAADALIADVRRSDPERLAAAIVRLADLELGLRGGSELDEDTQALRAIAAIAA